MKNEIRESEFQEKYSFDGAKWVRLTKEQYEMIGQIVTRSLCRQLKGKVFTQVESLGLPDKQEKAHRGLLGKAINESVDDILQDMFAQVPVE